VFLSRSPAFASVCTLASTLVVDTLNYEGLPFNQWYLLHVMTGVFLHFKCVIA